ncbi:hypothetical protein [Arthrobacter rhizosphaerae]|uniref:hypothetical protein n=1 Tax=Arthrobacter rhizosphaerae TaxID=2855490 RepID=UPI001FF5CE1F|nr:hypothetical protein [Arthrobacter rhizosphaerae]
MTNGTPRYLILGGAMALLGTVIVVLLIKSTGEDGPDGGPSVAGRASFTISGDAVEAIVPGKSAAIDLEFTNPEGLPFTVSGVRVRVLKVTAPQAPATRPCSISDYTVQQLPPETRITIPARGTGTLSGLGLPREDWPRVGLVNDSVNQDSCKGASLELAYTATGSGE